jgi:hypothetical protein
VRVAVVGNPGTIGTAVNYLLAAYRWLLRYAGVGTIGVNGAASAAGGNGFDFGSPGGGSGGCSVYGAACVSGKGGDGGPGIAIISYVKKRTLDYKPFAKLMG